CGCPGKAVLRMTKESHAFVTDGGHLILDAALGRISDPKSLATRLATIPGVVEHGLFIGLARIAILAGPDGIRIVEPACYHSIGGSSSMTTAKFARMLVLGGAALASWCGATQAQQPTPGAVEAAKEVLVLKGGMTIFNPIIPGVVEGSKGIFLQQNP